jgi:hypothetical protein
LTEDKKLHEEELNKAKPRHSWLENRIQSHKEALKHWESLKNAKEEEITA